MAEQSKKELSSTRIAIADYDMGNRTSVMNALKAVDAIPQVTRDSDELRRTAGIILPGVGAYPAAMEKIRRYGLDQELQRARLAGKPILGICLGHQLLFEASDEHRYTSGLGFLPGAAKKLPGSGGRMNVGWSPVSFIREAVINEGLVDPTDFYHLHSYAVVPEDDSVVFACSAYPVMQTGARFGTAVSGIQSGNLYGTQFHPEKSSKDGLCLLRNFVEISASVQAEL